MTEDYLGIKALFTDSINSAFTSVRDIFSYNIRYILYINRPYKYILYRAYLSYNLYDSV